MTTFGPLDTDATNTCDICHDDTLMGFEMVAPGRCKNCQPANLPVIAQPLMIDLPIEVLRWQAAFWEMASALANTFDDTYYATRALDLIQEHIELFDGGPGFGYCPDMPSIDEAEQEPLPAMIALTPAPETDLVTAEAEIISWLVLENDSDLEHKTRWVGVKEAVIADWMSVHGLELGNGGPLTESEDHWRYQLVEQNDGEVIGYIEYIY